MLAYTFLLRGQIITVDRSLYTGFGPEINEKPRLFCKLFTRMTLQISNSFNPSLLFPVSRINESESLQSRQSNKPPQTQNYHRHRW